MLRCCLLTLLLLTQDVDLVEQLGDPDVAVREQATTALAERGSAAREDLLRARKHRDPEIRARALDLLCRFDREMALDRLMKTQRGRKMTLLAGGGNENGANTAVTDGARFWFTRRAWAPQGEILGTIIETVEESYLQGTLRWSVASARSDTDLSVETCGLHSPRLVYLPGVPPDRVVVTLKGTRHWRCDVPVEFKNPAENATQRIGSFTLMMREHGVHLKSDKPVLASMLREAIAANEIEVRFKPGREDLTGFGVASFGCRIGCGGRVTKNPAWCGCDGHPWPGVAAPPELAQEQHIRMLHDYAFDDLESLSFPFHMPVEESFELKSPALK